MATKKPKLTAADKLEEAVRLSEIEKQISILVIDMQNIELNAEWCATPEGSEAQMEQHNYTQAQLAAVLEKQEANRARLRLKADLLKTIYNKRVST